MLSESVEHTNQASQQLSDSIYSLQNLIDSYKSDANPQQQIYKAKANLLSWKNQVQGFLQGYTEIDESHAGDYHHCGFGKWYYSTDAIYLQDIEAFKNIESLHIKQHELLEQVLSLKHQNKEDSVDAMSKELFDCTEQIADKLEQIATQLGIKRDSKINNFSANDKFDEGDIDFF